VCEQTVPGSYDIKEFKAPASGRLKVEMGGYLGYWDLLLLDGAKRGLGHISGTPDKPQPVVVTVRLSKPGTFYIVACNWSGGPTANMKYTYFYD